jgi:hypothetical protein
MEGPEILIYKASRGGIVNKPTIALKLSEIYISAAYGNEELARQLPLAATDEGNSWLIQGSAKQRAQQRGAVVVRIVKENGRVLNLIVPRHLNDGPD